MAIDEEIKCEFCRETIKPRLMTTWKTCCLASFLRRYLKKEDIKELIKFLKK